MFIVYIEDDEMHKELLFITESEELASNFQSDINKSAREVREVYKLENMNRDSKEVKDGINVIMEKFKEKNIEIFQSTVEMIIFYCDHVHYDEIKKLWMKIFLNYWNNITTLPTRDLIQKKLNLWLTKYEK